MKKTIFVLACMLCSVISFAQTFTYAYDAAGNRVLREAPEPPQAAVLSSVLPEKDSVVSSTPALLEAKAANEPAFAVNIYPNPTSGHLTLELPELQRNEQGEITIHSSMGQLVYRQASVSEIQSLSLYSLSPGYYIVRIVIGDKMVTKTVIKQ